jgi:thioredoxin
MSTLTITKENFNETIENNNIVILDFWASWCRPCLNFAPIFEEASNKHPTVVFGKINTEEEIDLSGAFGVRSIPTVVIFREKIMLFKQPGSLPIEAFDDILEEIGKLNMDDVRSQVAEAQQAEEAKEESSTDGESSADT